MVFRIGQAEVQKRRKNILLGFLFSIGMVVAMAMGNAQNVDRYNDFLLGSVVFFVVFANIINIFRHFQWKNMILVHQVEVLDQEMIFTKGKDKSVLKIDQIIKVQVARRAGTVSRMIIELSGGNKIRLEGYDNMDDFAKAIMDRVGEGKVVG